MLNVHMDGDDRHRLEDQAGAQVGWIRGRAIGFTGLATERDALRAAATGSRALQVALRRQYPGWPQYEPAFEALKLVHDGAYEWVSDGKVPLARLVRPGAGTAGARYGLEYVLPSFASEGVAIAIAQALAYALQGHLTTTSSTSSASVASIAG
jgi:hypothetical protein